MWSNQFTILPKVHRMSFVRENLLRNFRILHKRLEVVTAACGIQTTKDHSNAICTIQLMHADFHSCAQLCNVPVLFFSSYIVVFYVYRTCFPRVYFIKMYQPLARISRPVNSMSPISLADCAPCIPPCRPPVSRQPCCRPFCRC